MSQAQSSLATLLGTASASSFLTTCWPARVFHTRLDPAGWPPWLRSDLLDQPAKLDAIYRGRVDVTRGRRAQYRVEGAPVSRWVDDLGLTVRLTEMERYLPGAAEWLRGLERELGIPSGSCELNAFLNAAGAGLSAHCDPSEHLLIHVKGRKQIGLYPSPEGSYYSASHSLVYTPSPREAAQRPEGFPVWHRALPEDAQRLELLPGSVVFMPRGCYHETLGGDEGPSLSLVVRMLVPNYADLLLGYLRDYLVQDPAWRTPAMGAWSADERARESQCDRLKALLEASAPQLAQLDTQRMIARLPRGGADQPLLSTTRFVRNPSVCVDIDAHAGKVRVHAELGLGASTDAPLSAQACSLVADIAALRAPCSFAALCDRFSSWDAASLSMVVRFLVRCSVLIELPVEPYRDPPSPSSAQLSSASQRARPTPATTFEVAG